MPIVGVVLFLIGLFMIYNMDKYVIIFYAVIYFSIGIATMFATVFVRKKLNKA